MPTDFFGLSAVFLKKHLTNEVYNYKLREWFIIINHKFRMKRGIKK